MHRAATLVLNNNGFGLLAQAICKAFVFRPKVEYGEIPFEAHDIEQHLIVRTHIDQFTGEGVP